MDELCNLFENKLIVDNFSPDEFVNEIILKVLYENNINELLKELSCNFTKIIEKDTLKNYKKIYCLAMD